MDGSTYRISINDVDIGFGTNELFGGTKSGHFLILKIAECTRNCQASVDSAIGNELTNLSAANNKFTVESSLIHRL